MAKKVQPEAQVQDDSLSLLVKSPDQSSPNVDAEDFFRTAERWLNSLKAFASGLGEQVTWEITGLRKSSAFVCVRPMSAKTRRPVPVVSRKWREGVAHMERTGRAPAEFSRESLRALHEFVSQLPEDSVVAIGAGAKPRHRLSVLTAERVTEALSVLPVEQPREYSVRGRLRGRLAVLNSWNPSDRYFRLQLPLAPQRAVNCKYADTRLITDLGEGFEGIVEINGTLHYKSGEPWPHTAEIDNIRVLPRETMPMRELVGAFHLPEGQDSVAYVRSIRDAE